MGTKKLSDSFFISLSVLLLLTSRALAQTKKLNLAYSATSPYQAPLIIAKEAGFLKKNGLDVSLIFTPGGSLGFQAMMGGDVAMVLADGSAAVAGKLSGADILIKPSFFQTLSFTPNFLSGIKKVEKIG